MSSPKDRRPSRPAFKVFVVAALLGGLAVTMNFPVATEKAVSETPMMVHTPVATI